MNCELNILSVPVNSCGIFIFITVVPFDFVRFFIKTNSTCAGGEGGGGTPCNGLYREAPPERGTFFTRQVYERVGISRVEVYERVGKSVI